MAAPSRAWSGVREADGGFQATCRAPSGAAPLQVQGLQTRAEAAAAYDLLQAWALQQQGQQLSAAQFNLEQDRYRHLLQELTELRSAEAVQDHVKHLYDKGLLLELTSGVSEGGARETGAAGAAAASGTPAAAGAARRAVAGREGGGDSPPAAAVAAAGGGQEPQQQHHQGGGEAGTPSEAVTEATSDSRGQQPAGTAAAAAAGGLGGDPAGEALPGGDPGSGHGSGVAKKPRGGGGFKPPGKKGGSSAQYAGTTYARGWTTQVHFLRKQLAPQFAHAMEPGRDRHSLTLALGSAPLAAVAADLAMMYRGHLSGVALDPKRLNFPRETYRDVQAQIFGCATILDLRDLLKELRDDGTLERLAAQAKAPSAAGGAAGAAGHAKGAGGPPVAAGADLGRGLLQEQGEEEQGRAGVGGKGPGRTEASPGGRSQGSSRELRQLQQQQQAQQQGWEAGLVTRSASTAERRSGRAAASLAGQQQQQQREVRRSQQGASPPHTAVGLARGGSLRAEPRTGVKRAVRVAVPRSLSSPSEAEGSSDDNERGVPGQATEAEVAATTSPQEAAPRLKGARNEVAGSDGRYETYPDFTCLLALSNGWACQVGVVHGRLAARHKDAILAKSGRYIIRVPGMTRPQAAAAADLALMWRRRVYGESVDGQPYNYPYDVYLSLARAAVRQMETCRTAEGAKDILRQLRDGPLLSQLAAEGQARLGRGALGSARLPRQAQQAQRSGVAPPSSPTPPAKRPREQQQQQQPAGKAPAKAAAPAPYCAGGGGGKRAAAAAPAAVSKSPRGVAALHAEVAAPPAKRRWGRGTTVAARRGTSAAGKRRGAEAVGHGVRVFWSMDSQWYTGVIVGFHPATGLHHVIYDDGEEHHLDLSEETYRLTKKRRNLTERQQVQLQLYYQGLEDEAAGSGLAGAAAAAAAEANAAESPPPGREAGLESAGPRKRPRLQGPEREGSGRDGGGGAAAAAASAAAAAAAAGGGVEGGGGDGLGTSPMRRPHVIRLAVGLTGDRQQAEHAQEQRQGTRRDPGPAALPAHAGSPASEEISEVSARRGKALRELRSLGLTPSLGSPRGSRLGRPGRADPPAAAGAHAAAVPPAQPRVPLPVPAVPAAAAEAAAVEAAAAAGRAAAAAAAAAPATAPAEAAAEAAAGAGAAAGHAEAGWQRREETERMFGEVQRMLRLTPGLGEGATQGFLSRYLQIPETMRIQYREIKHAHEAGRDDLVREWVWGAVVCC